MILLHLLKESFLFAINSLKVNKLRTFLSLLGITIGIFAIISVFTVIDALENSIRESIANLGDDVVYVQKWPWGSGGEYPWWKYMNRPLPRLSEVEEISQRSQYAKAVAFIAASQKSIQYNDNSADGVTVFCASYSYQNIKNFEIDEGRYFSPIEAHTGNNVAVIGATVAEQLFRDVNPVGREIKLLGHKVLIIGVFKREGDDMFGLSTDEQVMLPVNYARQLFDLRSEQLNPFIMVKAKEHISTQELIDELRGIMRSVRRLKPNEEDDFALNQTSLLTQGFQQLFGVIDLAGIIIGGFSILVGGFGIANIMFVSVKEQTRIIGIQKALGAKRFFVLMQFLSEAVVLAVIGGVVGLLIIFLGTLLVNSVTDMTFYLSAKNIFIGIGISVAIGILSGFLPAQSAARLNPVDAMSAL